MDQKNIRHIAFFGLFLIGVIFGGILLWPFLKVVILAIALAIIFHPLYRWLVRRVTRGNKWIASFITILVFTVIVCGPFFLISRAVVHQTQSIILSVTQSGQSSVLLDRANSAIQRAAPWAQFQVQDKIAAVANTLTSKLGDVVGFVFGLLFSFLLMLLTMFYFLKDGPGWRQAIITGSPLSDENTKKIITKLTLAVNGVIKGNLFVALIQGVLLGLGLWLFGVPNPALWGVFAGIASLVPTIGTGLISIPSVIFLFVTGHTGAALGLAVWAGALVGTIDNLVSPIIVGHTVDIHPMFILFAVLGGVTLMGPIGILIGPLVVSFIYALTAVYSSEMKG